jgi:aspartokinase
MKRTYELCKEVLQNISQEEVVVVTGFAGGDKEYNTVLLDRG